MIQIIITINKHKKKGVKQEWKEPQRRETIVFVL